MLYQKPKTVADQRREDIRNAVRYALPGAFGLGCITGYFHSSLGVIFYPYVIMMHELGHAVVYWLNSQLALPAWWGMTVAMTGRSLAFGAVMVVIWSLLVFRGWQQDSKFAMAVGIFALAMQGWVTLVASPYKVEMYAILFGNMGELLIPTLFIVAFYYELPDYFNWNFWRFVLLIPSVHTIMQSVMTWLKVYDYPYASLAKYRYSRVVADDVPRLVYDYGWDTRHLAWVYLATAAVCMGIIAVHYAGGLIKVAARG